jgi:hypothetical protein
MAWDDDAYYETELEIPSGRYGKLIAIPGGPGPTGPPGPEGPASTVPGPPGPAGSGASSWDEISDKPEGVPGGYPVLDEDGKVPEEYLPPSAELMAELTDVTPVGLAVGTAVDERAARAAIGDTDIRVSAYVAGTATYQEAIEAAITVAAARPNGVVDFEGVIYETTGTVSVSSPGVTLTSGGITTLGEFPALRVLAADVTVRGLTFSRAKSSPFSDTVEARSCVSVSAQRFSSIDCNYLATAHSCVYLANGKCDGAVIRGGEMTGSAAVQDASGIYAASGSIGNQNLTIDGVYVHDTVDGFFLFDTGSSVVTNNKVESLRRLPTLTLTGWTLVSGNVYRKRSAPGTNPGVDGPLTDRADGNTSVIKNNGTPVPTTSYDSTTPGANETTLSGGYVYVNLAGVDPNTRTMTSDIVSGYGIATYVYGDQGTNEALMCRNRISGNYIKDVDGFGIYLQLGRSDGAQDNHVVNNTLKDVCLEGSQTPMLPFAGIGVTSGSDTLLMGNTINGVGSAGKEAPGVYVARNSNDTKTRGRIVGTTVTNGFGRGFQIYHSNWSLDGCHAHKNTSDGFQIFQKAGVVQNVTLSNCHSSANGGQGILVDGSFGGALDHVSAHIIGGSVVGNASRGIVLYSAGTTSTVRDCMVSGVSVRDNGLAFSAVQQIWVRGMCSRVAVTDCSISSTGTFAVGVGVDAIATETVVGANQYNLATPETLNGPVRIGGGKTAGSQWKGTGSPEAVVTAPQGSIYQRLDSAGVANFFVKMSGTGSTGWVAMESRTSADARYSQLGHTHVAADVVGALSWTTTVPGTPAAAGTRGQFTSDGQFLYVCVTSGAAGAAAWKRLAYEIWI